MIQAVIKLLRSSLGFKRPKTFRTYYKDVKESRYYFV
jgi:ribosomal protein S18 acetylase RimI-like enzyme